MISDGIGELHFSDRILKDEEHIKTLKENMLPSHKHLGKGAMFQYDNDPKHSAKKTTVFEEAKSENI